MEMSEIDPAVDALRRRLAGPGAPDDRSFAAAGQWLEASPGLRTFYRDRGSRLAWSTTSGPLARAAELIDRLGRARADGLDPKEFRLAAIERTHERCQQELSVDCLVDLDLLLSDGFLRCASALHRGSVLPSQLHLYWQVREPNVNLASLLQTAIDLDQITLNLDAMRPTLAGYRRLRSALSTYRNIAEKGGWDSLPAETQDGSPGWGDRLRSRLIESGDLQVIGRSLPATSEVVSALRRFQTRHGLVDTGVLDEATRAALDVTVEHRIEQLRLNLERWRWLPHRQGSRYVLVRIADYELDVVEDGTVIENMRVIVGKPFWRTPIFSSRMTHLVFNPPWYVPKSIVVADFLPRVRTDSTFLERRDILVYQGAGDSATVVAPDAIEWAAGEQGLDIYRFTQLPGPLNPLGRVKFHFDNPFQVFLHDTPRGELFARERRDFSHGCIRLEKSLELARYALAGDPAWSEVDLEATIAEGKTVKVELASPLSVYVMSWTAWVDGDGDVHFRDDIAGDEKLRDRMAGLE